MHKNTFLLRALALVLPLSLAAAPDLLLAAQKKPAAARKAQAHKPPAYREAVVAAQFPADAAQHMQQLNADTSTPVLAAGAKGAAVLRAQTMLDRAWFSPGEIDGIFSSNMLRAVKAFQLSRGLPTSGVIDGPTWAALAQQQAPVFATYTLTAQDLGPYQRLPADPVQQAQLPALGYQHALEALAERFHLAPKVLAALNKGRPARAGQQIVVADVARPMELPALATSVRIDKSDRMLYVLGDGERVIAGFPVSFGGDEDPLPVGTMRITSKVKNPNFSYDPKLLRNARADAKLRLPPGPNNPVGVMWLGLTKEHWGIHGTAEPAQMARVQTNGCVRLTNWDVLRLATMAAPGMPVDVQS